MVNCKDNVIYYGYRPYECSPDGAWPTTEMADRNSLLTPEWMVLIAHEMCLGTAVDKYHYITN